MCLEQKEQGGGGRRERPEPAALRALFRGRWAVEAGLRFRLEAPGSQFLWVYVDYMVQTLSVMLSRIIGQLQEEPGHALLTLSTWHGTGFQRPKEPPGPASTEMESEPTFTFRHRDSYMFN